MCTHLHCRDKSALKWHSSTHKLGSTLGLLHWPRPTAPFASTYRGQSWGMPCTQEGQRTHKRWATGTAQTGSIPGQLLAHP